MRKPIIAGNWKMHKTVPESATFAEELKEALADMEQVDMVVCPTYVALKSVSDVLNGTGVEVGAQSVHWEASGAYTSQIAPQMLSGIAEYVIIGHSEVREYLAETDERVNKKVKAALAVGLKPIIAVGESLVQNEAGETESFVGQQVRAALQDVTAEEMASVTLAYEPIWAIGTGKSASGEIANNIIGGVIRSTVRDLYGDDVADAVRIQYGGSVKPANIEEYMAQPDIDGALVGGACLKIDSFKAIISAASESAKQ